MDCQHCSENLSAYLDGELSRDHRSELESHLRLCSICTEEFHSLEQAIQFVNTHTNEIDPSPLIWYRVRTRITAETVPSGYPITLQWFQIAPWKPLTVALAAVLILSLGIWRYVRYYESQQALQQYMSQYIGKRESQEQKHRVDPGPAGTLHPRHQEFSDNPFAVASDDATYSNPFRAD